MACPRNCCFLFLKRTKSGARTWVKKIHKQRSLKRNGSRVTERSSAEGVGAEGSGADIEVRLRNVPAQKVLAQKVPVQLLKSNCGRFQYRC